MKSAHSSIDKNEIHDTLVSSRIVGATTAGLRALASQLFTFYVRVPVKLFRPTRVDYLAIPRAINPIYKEKPWSLFTHSGPALLAHAVKTYGWSFIPNHVLPPLVANSAVGLVLYSTYLTTLTLIQKSNEKEAADECARTGIPRLPGHFTSSVMLDSFYAGAMAGAAQSLAAAPIDAIVTRFSASELLDSGHKTMWSYGLEKLREIGPRGVFSGFSLSLVKESLGFALFFSTFETIKGPWYRTYINTFHDGDTKKGTRALYPSFILFAGAMSSISVQLVHYPLGKIQKLYLMRLEAVDEIARQQDELSKKNELKAQKKAAKPAVPLASTKKLSTILKELVRGQNRKPVDLNRLITDWVFPPHSIFRLYSKAYSHTFKQIHKLVVRDAGGSWGRWLYGGFVRATLATMPSTSIGLVVFEIMRLRYATMDNSLAEPSFNS